MSDENNTLVEYDGDIFEPLEEESPKQKRFRADMEKAGIKVEVYSGRGMFGAETYAVFTDSEGPTEQEVYSATKVKLSRDSLGKGFVLYVE